MKTMDLIWSFALAINYDICCIYISISYADAKNTISQTGIVKWYVLHLCISLFEGSWLRINGGMIKTSIYLSMYG